MKFRISLSTYNYPKYLVVFCILVLFVPFLSHAAVSSFSFTIAPGVLAVNDASCKFTVTANEIIPETFDIYLTSTGSGAFSSSSTNWVPVTKITMSTGTANRSFYYKGSSAGSVTITATAKPRSGSGEFPAKTTVTIGGSSNCDGGESSNSDTPDEDTESADDEHATTEKADDVILVEPDPIYTASMIVPTTVVRGIPALFESIVEKEMGTETITKLGGRYEWSMGDGTQYIFEKNTPINHAYAYAGDYTVVFRYYSNDFKEKPDSIHRKTITVLSDAVVISKILPDGGIALQNNSGKELDLGGWVLESYGRTYTVPEYTYVPPTKELLVAPHIHQIATIGEVHLKNNQGVTLFAYGKIPEVSEIARRNLATIDTTVRKISAIASTQSASMNAISQSEGKAGAVEITEVEAATAFDGVQGKGGAKNTNLPVAVFIVLVIAGIVGYSVYIYGRRRNLRKNEGTGVGTLADEFDIEDVIKNP